MTRTGLIVHQCREFFGISHAIRYLSLDKQFSDQPVHGDALEIGITATASTAVFNFLRMRATMILPTVEEIVSRDAPVNLFVSLGYASADHPVYAELSV